jgi:hypothetical protein
MSLTTEGTLLIGAIDDYLGPSATRFFGAGYRRVDYDVHGVELANTDDGRAILRAGVAIRYPTDWSTKGDRTDLRPHLSTIDAIILAVRAAEFRVRHSFGLTPTQQARIWLRRVDIKAPTRPVEDTLRSLIVTATHTATLPEHGRLVSTYDCRVETMRVRVELVHDSGEPVVGTDLDLLFGAGYPGLYGGGFRYQSQRVDGAVVDVAAQRASASVLIDSPPDHPALAGGLESAHGPVVSMVDSFAVTLQLGQVLLYAVDGTSRGASSTLWMRHTTITAVQARARPVGGRFDTTTMLQDSRRLDANGGTWRTAAITGDCLGVRTRCAVTHRLPDKR